jgi:hypothetical protein
MADAKISALPAVVSPSAASEIPVNEAGTTKKMTATQVGTAIGAYVVGGTDVAVADGGTGQSSYTDGQLLIGNTTGNTLTKATITAGSGISVTNGNGSITIATTGSGSGTSTGLSLSLAQGRFWSFSY